MPTPEQVLGNISNQMMKGLRQGRYAEGSTPVIRTMFLNRHRKLIEELMTHLPRASSAAGAVICKCAIKYGREKAMGFAEAVGDGSFNGQNDPVLLFWHYLMRSKNKTTLAIYQNAVTACRAYCEGRTLTHLRPAGQDIFEWNECWEAPDFEKDI